MAACPWIMIPFSIWKTPWEIETQRHWEREGESRPWEKENYKLSFTPPLPIFPLAVENKVYPGFSVWAGWARRNGLNMFKTSRIWHHNSLKTTRDRIHPEPLELFQLQKIWSKNMIGQLYQNNSSYTQTIKRVSLMSYFLSNVFNLEYCMF